MKRDMELIRKILMTIEDEYKPEEGFLWNLKVDGYDAPTIAEHCNLMEEGMLIKAYGAEYADDEMQTFRVGSLTARGYEYLELIRSNEVWDKTKTEIETKKLPNTYETITIVAAMFLTLDKREPRV